jgi:suppressor for copper-sensitivity B
MVWAMGFNSVRRLCGRLCTPSLLALLASAPAFAAIGEWQGQGPAKVRLISAGIDGDGRIAAGIEIALEPGWKTYWRSPGDAGIAPLTDFSASTNITGPVEVAFPVPHRYDDGFSVTNVYENHTVLLVDAAADDPQASTKLTAALDIGVCAEICIPEHYDLALDVEPAAPDPEAAAILAEARRSLPGQPLPGVFQVDAIKRTGGDDKRPQFEISIVAPEAAKTEIFVEGPVDWYPSMPTLVSSDGTRATFSLEFNRLGSKTEIGGNVFRVTVLSDAAAIEDIVTLD